MSAKTLTYFIKSTSSSNIKIGHTDDLEQRLKALQSASGCQLIVLGVIHCDIEDVLHIRFAKWRLHNEWFSPHPDILKYVARYSQKWTPRVASKSMRGTFRANKYMPPLAELMQQASVSPSSPQSICLNAYLPELLKRGLLMIGIETVDQMHAMTLDDEIRLLSIPGIGTKTIESLHTILGRFAR